MDFKASKMKITYTFERDDLIGGWLRLKIWMRFDCSYDEFHEWVEKHAGRLLIFNEGMKSFDIDYSDKTIYFTKI